MIRQRGDTWQVDFRSGGDRIRRGGFEHKHEALAWEAEARRRLSLGIPLDTREAPESTNTIRSLVDLVSARCWHGTANEVEAVRLANEAALFFGEDEHPSSITQSRLDDYVIHLRKRGNSPGTINRKLAAVSKLLTFAKLRGIISKSPTIEREAESEGRLRWFTKDEEAALIAAFPQRSVVFLLFLLDTGGRLGESLAVLRKDVSNGAVTFVKTKSGRLRSIKLTRRVREAIEPLLVGEGAGRLFEGITEDTFREDWQTARKACGLESDPDAVPHACRHTCASRLVQAGVAIQVVKEWLGHASLNMTLRYAHLAPKNIHDAVSALES
jgi:integrase